MSSLVKWSCQWKPRSIHRLVQVVLKDHLEDHHPILWASIVAKMTRGTEIFIHLIANRSYRLLLTNLSPLTKSKWTCPSNSLWTLPSMCVLKFKFHSAHNEPWARHRAFPYNQYDADGTHRLRLRNTVSRQTWGMDSRLSQPCYWCWFDKYLVDAIRSFMETSRNAWVWIITGFKSEFNYLHTVGAGLHPVIRPRVKSSTIFHVECQVPSIEWPKCLITG